MPSDARQTSASFFYTSPGHLRAAAHLYGVSSVPLEAARVLELGCGAGGNLLPFALAYPDARVVGIDMWPDEIQAGRQAIQDLGVKNLELLAQPFTDIDQSLGEFDYIIAHDGFTWAPSDVRAAIMRICRDNLSAQGLAYISYNTYPGWKAGDTLRDAMQMHTHSAQTAAEALGGATAMLTLMSDGLFEGHPQKAEILSAIARIREHPEYYLNSDFLQASTSAFYFVEFAGAAGEGGLSYIGDALPHNEISSIFGKNVQLNHSLMAIGQPKVMRQQYLDFAMGRQFRRSLFIRQERTDTILSLPDLGRFTDLRWAANFQWVGASRKQTISHATFINPKGIKVDLDNPYAIHILSALDDAWPATLSYADLVFCTQQVDVECADEQQHTKAVQRALESLFEKGILRYSLGAGPYDQARNANLAFIPCVSAAHLAAQPTACEIATFNLWHDTQTIRLTGKQRELLAMFDGATNIAALHDNDAADPAALISVVTILKRLGALIGCDSAWLAYYQAQLKNAKGTREQKLAAVGPLFVYANVLSRCDAANPTTRQGKAGYGIHSRKAEDTAPSPSQQQLKHILQLKKQGKLAEAADSAQRLTEKFPDHPSSWNMATIIAIESNRVDDCFEFALKAIALKPSASNPYAHLSACLNQTQMWVDSRLNAARALILDPQNADAWNNMGNHYRHCTMPAQARICYQHMVNVAPHSAIASANLANVLGDLGNIKEAVEWNERTLKLEPNNFRILSNQLFTLSQSADISAERFVEAHQDYGRRVEAFVRKIPKLLHTNIKNTDRPLRLGFVSGDLYDHAVANFIEPIWQHIDKTSFEIYAYQASPVHDNVSRRLRGYVKEWVPASTMSDEALAARIHADAIDILFDLSGHTGHNRLPMFALKPAPVQVSWIGYPATTGLTAMDYYLSDNHFAPPALFENQFTEKLALMPISAAFKPWPNSPEVNGLPAMSNPYFTFASFNRMSKIGDEVYRQWARILDAVPTSKFMLGNVYDGIRKEVTAQFGKHGIGPERLILKDRATIPDYLRLHHQVDLLLDTFPYSGGTTTLHGMWMGVPTVTLTGNTIPRRTTSAILSQVELHGFTTTTLNEYIDTAISWSQRTDELSALRQGMRERMLTRHSAEFVTKHLEIALHQMWEIWCAGEKSKSFEIAKQPMN
ncbi:O-linked N-acetylglucosamine transferase family protein [Pollutimonas bauzanensis]|uniref:O-linked N-acetylglucosamine transferase family protein n=1 Tax=Pollutimonas bauzanensis TaxID=658167 RepID=UPI0009329725|nr:methyltransferase regulatory domain-containing protein [Pollutimonas bauzanensis]